MNEEWDWRKRYPDLDLSMRRELLGARTECAKNRIIRKFTKKAEELDREKRSVIAKRPRRV